MLSAALLLLCRVSSYKVLHFYCNAECRYAMRRSEEWQHVKYLGANLKNKDTFFPFEMKLQETFFFTF
jgi:hypothetical protein